jgi:hypothetical protein
MLISAVEGYLIIQPGLPATGKSIQDVQFFP